MERLKRLQSATPRSPSAASIIPLGQCCLQLLKFRISSQPFRWGFLAQFRFWIWSVLRGRHVFSRQWKGMDNILLFQLTFSKITTIYGTQVLTTVEGYHYFKPQKRQFVYIVWHPWTTNRYLFWKCGFAKGLVVFHTNACSQAREGREKLQWQKSKWKITLAVGGVCWPTRKNCCGPGAMFKQAVEDSQTHICHHVI